MVSTHNSLLLGQTFPAFRSPGGVTSIRSSFLRSLHLVPTMKNQTCKLSP